MPRVELCRTFSQTGHLGNFVYYWILRHEEARLETSLCAGRKFRLAPLSGGVEGYNGG